MCFYQCHCSMCFSFRFVLFIHLYVHVLPGPNKAELLLYFCICAPVNADGLLMVKLLHIGQLLFICLMTQGDVLLATREPTVYTKWQSYSLMKICVL